MLNIILDSLLKMFVATLCGAILGISRTMSAKQAGIKTHALLSLSTCSLICVTNLIEIDEIARVIAGIVQGIGFLGAGVIYLSKDQHTIRGLTSSVILWLDGVIGIICGTDYWYLGILIIIIFYVVMFVMVPIEKKIKEKYIHNISNNNIEKDEDDD